MGANMARRLIRGGHECVVFDRSQKAMDELVADGAKGAATCWIWSSGSKARARSG